MIVRSLKTIRLLFMKPDANDAFMNRLVGRYDGPYCHVEIEFDEGTHQAGMASSVFFGESVFMHRRTFANPRYDVLSFTVSHQQYEKMHAYCRSEAQSGTEFSSLAMLETVFSCCAPVSALLGSGGTCCSKHVASALKAGDFADMRGVNPRHMTPSSLHRRLSKSKARCFSSVPYKIDLMTIHPQT